MTRMAYDSKLKDGLMTKTEVSLRELQNEITHLTGISEQGWILRWGDTPETCFEVVCKKANALRVKEIDRLLTRAHETKLKQL